MTKRVYLSSDATDAVTFGKHKTSEQPADTRLPSSAIFSQQKSYLNLKKAIVVL